MKHLLCLALLMATTPAMAGDWTALVKGMQDNCHINQLLPIIRKEESLPKHLKADVISHQAMGNPIIIEEGMGVFTLNLKNAKAFGHPLKK